MALGSLHFMTGDYESAATAQREAISIYEDAWGRDALGLEWMLSRFAVTLSNIGEFQEAIRRTNALTQSAAYRP